VDSFKNQDNMSIDFIKSIYSKKSKDFNGDVHSKSSKSGLSGDTLSENDLKDSLD